MEIISMQGYRVQAGPQYEIEGIAEHLAADKLASKNPLDVATPSCDLLDFNDDDIDAAIVKWRARQQGASLVLDFRDPANAQHRQKLIWMATFNIGSIAWRMLERAEDTGDQGSVSFLPRKNGDSRTLRPLPHQTFSPCGRRLRSLGERSEPRRSWMRGRAAGAHRRQAT